jgi:hypothetical protein
MTEEEELAFVVGYGTTCQLEKVTVFSAESD